MAINAPHLPYPKLRQLATEFLNAHHPSGIIPVPIERIVEFEFGIDIVPTPGLHDGFEIDSYVTSDLTAIHVDRRVYERYSTRYRFSLAHEIAHVVLHQDVFVQLQFTNIAEWKTVVTSIPAEDYSWIEWQAYAFAGLILVPAAALKEVFDAKVGEARRFGVDLRHAPKGERRILESHLGRHFDVSIQVIQKRLSYDKLWQAG